MTRTWPQARFALACLAVSACCPLPLAKTPAGPDLASWPDAVDWQQAGDEAVEVLSGYLQVNTSNPPGNETAGARYLAAVLAREGIDSEIVEFAPGRGSLVARLEGSGEQPPLCLLSHIDVAEADASLWPPDKGPLSGAVDQDGYLWGRGALDMKGMGALELMTMVWLERLDVPLRRDVVLLAVADEEVHNQGMRHLVDEHWDRIGCSHIINEGGLGLKDLFFVGQTVYPISVAEKGVLWLRLTATGEGGHGSTPRVEHTPYRLLDALARLRLRKPDVRIHASLREFLARVGAHKGGAAGFVLRRPGMVDALLLGTLLAHPLTRAAVTDTISITGLDTGDNQPNVVPVKASARLDIRLLPGTSLQDISDDIWHWLGYDPSVELEVLFHAPALESPRYDELYDAIARRVVEDRPHAVAGPSLSVGFTDSLYARQKGARAYGMVPFEISQEEAATMHAPNERVSVENVRRGLRALFLIVMDVAADHSAAPRPRTDRR